MVMRAAMVVAFTFWSMRVPLSEPTEQRRGSKNAEKKTDGPVLKKQTTSGGLKNR